jgi:hypothetical protein
VRRKYAGVKEGAVEKTGRDLTEGAVGAKWRERAMRVATGMAVVSSALAAPAIAQDSSPAARPAPNVQSSFGVIAGTIVDTAGTRLPLVDVLILDARHLQARTNTSGGYRIDSVDAGLHLVRFRRIGLVPMTITVAVRGGEITGVDVVMGTAPHTLATMTVQDTLGEMSRLPPGVLSRIRSGMGTYITAADIERKHPMRTSQMLQFVAGAELTKDGAVNNTRGIISLKTPGCRWGIPVYIDGARVADPHLGADTLYGNPLADVVPPSAVAVIEVYRGAAELPGSLPQDKCGGLFIWTKQ